MTELSIKLLSTVPGLPPILQTIHLLGLTMLMASAVMMNLRLLNLAGRGQQLQEMLQRLFPWVFWALPVMLLSGLPFLLARPQRYLNNPVFAYKAAFLCLALILTAALWLAFRRGRIQQQTWLVKALALVSLSAWLMTAMSGRWIAYADYLFWPG
ncbi:DUF6644 family protein [Pseudohongiella sp.]|uniref:DUF6644 domain-containing protein n=1 Tax=marine sediment metagenome TaxID=412755 RepID=A0A0F9YEK0_9ZZZZ|nr:DUF6644 family protein [Pseudohongiella sp.]HDZ09875.1 hypothetical protein [Pseudohongiella sp.]HEA61510.1 hypothetical protein [Pseudohongiella sp.]